MSRSLASTGWCAVHGKIPAVIICRFPSISIRKRLCLFFSTAAPFISACSWRRSWWRSRLVVFSKTLFGYQVRLVGSAPKAARFGGFNDRTIAIAAFAISGGLAGLAGVVEVSGRIGQLLPSISPGYGFSAIIVAFLGRLSPVGIFIAGLVLALTFVGGEDAQIAMHLPGDLTLAFQGVLLICVLAADVLARYRLRFTWGARS